MYSYLISLCSCQILYMIFAVKWLLFYCLGYTHKFNVLNVNILANLL